MFERNRGPSPQPAQQPAQQQRGPQAASDRTPAHTRSVQQAASSLSVPPPDLQRRDLAADRLPGAQEVNPSADARKGGDISRRPDSPSPLDVEVTTAGKEFSRNLENAGISPDGKEHLGVFFKPPRDKYGRLDLRSVGVERLSDLAREHQSNTGESVHAIVGELQGMGKLNESVGNDAEMANGVISEFASALERAVGKNDTKVLLQGRIDKDRFAVFVSGASRADVIGVSERVQEQLVLYSGSKSLPGDKPLPKETRMYVGVASFDASLPLDNQVSPMIESNKERGDGVVASGQGQEVQARERTTLNIVANPKVSPMEIPSAWVMNPDVALTDVFNQQAKEAGIPSEAIENLQPKIPRDEITGGFDGRDGVLLDDMINRARHQHAEDPNNKVQLVAIDVANLGGMNGEFEKRKLEREVADGHVKKMISIASEHFKSQEAEVAVVRSGGDEFYMLVKGKGIDFQASIKNIEQLVQDYAKDKHIDRIKHTKKRRPRGVRLYLGTAEITAEQTARQIRSEADKGIDEKKGRRLQFPGSQLFRRLVGQG